MDDRGRTLPALRHELGVSEDQSDQERLLLARRALARRHFLGTMSNHKVAAMRAVERTTGATVALTDAGERARIGILDFDGGTLLE